MRRRPPFSAEPVYQKRGVARARSGLHPVGVAEPKRHQALRGILPGLPMIQPPGHSIEGGPKAACDIGKTLAEPVDGPSRSRGREGREPRRQEPPGAAALDPVAQRVEASAETVGWPALSAGGGRCARTLCR